MKNKKPTYHQEKDSRLLTTWDCFDNIYIKMEFQKITNLLDLLLKNG